MKKLLFFLTLIAAIATSCTSYVNINITDFSFTLESINEYSPATLKLVDDFNSVLKDEIILEKTSFCTYDISDIIKALNQDSANPLITISDDKKQYNININADNYTKLESIFPLLGDENVEAYGAKYNKDEDEESFFKILNYVFGEDIEKASRLSMANIAIRTPSAIKSVEGGKKENKNTISLSIPLIDFALLKTPIALSFTLE